MTILCQCGTDITDPARQFGSIGEEPECWTCYSREMFYADIDRDAPEPVQEAAWYEQVMEVEE